MNRLGRTPEFIITLALLCLLLIFQLLNSSFLSTDNLIVIFRASASTGLCAIGMAFLLISGMIDISIGSIAGLSSIVTALVASTFPDYYWLAIPAGVLSGIICGLINSELIQTINLSAFLATISTMYIYRGFAMTISKGYTIYPLPQPILDIGNAEPLGVSWAWVLFLAFVILGEHVLRNTVWGLLIKATGSDREIATWTEVPVKNITRQMFMLCGGMAALAGALLTTRVQAGQPSMGQGWELNAIAAVAIGGVSLSGYTGNMIGVILGVLLVQVLANGLVSIGMSAYIQPILIGIILASIAAMDIRKRIDIEIKGDSR